MICTAIVISVYESIIRLILTLFNYILSSFASAGDSFFALIMILFNIDLKKVSEESVNE